MSARVRITRTADGTIVIRSRGVTFVEPADKKGDAFALADDGRIGVEDASGVYRWCRVESGRLVPDHVVVRAGANQPVMNLAEVFAAIRRMQPIKIG